MNSDKQSVTWKWIAGILVGAVIMLIGSWAAGIQVRVNKHEDQFDKQAERMATIESRTSLMEQRYGFIDTRLTEIVTSQKAIQDALEKHRLEGRR